MDDCWFPYSKRTFGTRALPVSCEGKTITKTVEFSRERRKAIRFRMKAQAIFHWTKAGSARFQGEGTTRDVSRAGVYVLTSSCPPGNTTLQMEIILPFRTDSTTRIKARMKVLRVEPDIAGDGRSGFSAIRIGREFSEHSISKQSSAATKDAPKKIGGN